MNGFSITYQMTRADYQAMVQAVMHQARWYRVVVVVGCLSAWIAIALYGAKSMDQFWNFLAFVFQGRAAWSLYVTLAVLPILAFWDHLFAFAASFSFNKNALAKTPTTVRASGDDIVLSLDNISSTLTWSAITKVIETRKRVLLMVSTQQAVILPRRAFATQTDYLAARDFALAHVDLEVPVADRT